MELRNPIDTISRLTPALVALLYHFLLIGNINYETIDFKFLYWYYCLLLITCIISPPALINRFNEADCGRWWQVNLELNSCPIKPIYRRFNIITLPLTYLSWIILIGDKSELYSNDVVVFGFWFPALCMLDLAIAFGTIFSS